MQTDQPSLTQNEENNPEPNRPTSEVVESSASSAPVESAESQTTPPVQNEANPKQTETSPPAPVVEVKPSSAEQTFEQKQSITEQPIQVGAPTPAPAQASTSTTTTPTQDDTALDAIEAADAELIEKEWVDQADEIIAKRANDPAGEDDAEADLSQAYIKNRFNVDIEDAQ